MELDDAYRHADIDLRSAESDEQDNVDEFRLIRQHVICAHDLVGESNVSAAVEELSRVVEIKIGLGETEAA